ncbi:BEACH domain-containing protein B [Linum perenne]
MNIVKGVADLIRRTSSIPTGESSPRSTSEKFPAPAPKICFGEGGDEAILRALWEKHEGTADKVEKRKLFHVFLKQFVAVYKNWVPANSGQFIETTPTSNAGDYPSFCDDVVIGCFAGHPAEVILTLIEEIGHITTLIAPVNTNGTHAGVDLSQSTSLTVSSEGLPVLDALTIITRSMHNCRVFGCYTGVQKLTALLKGTLTIVLESPGMLTLIIRELLRVIRRLSLKEQWTDISLQYLTLKILHVALVENPRGQNHFKSIGGLEVLLDGLGLPSINVLLLKNATYAGDRRFRNLSSLQYLCENGRIQKFANSFCSLAFMLQDYRQKIKEADSNLPLFDLKSESHVMLQPSFPLRADASHSHLWSEHVVKLSRVLCSFVVAPETIKSQINCGPTVIPVSSAYGELSIRWVMRVLLTIFPCMKACSNQNELPSLSRVFLNALQHCVLDAFRKILVSSPLSLEIFREEGIWDMIFSDNFFYFGPASVESTAECFTNREGFPGKLGQVSVTNNSNSSTGIDSIEILQMEIVSFVEFAATCKGSVHNLPELSALLDALEQCSCHSLIAKILAKSLLRIFRLSSEKSIASFKTLNAISRVLKVACIQAEEFRVQNISSDPRSDAHAVTHSQAECIETCMGLFTEFFMSANDAKSLVLHEWTCIECLFELFWQGGMRNQVLEHVLNLMKIKPSSVEDQKAKLQLCSKYLETFTQIKEREKNYAELSIDLLSGMKEMLTDDPAYYQALFRDGECFLHVVSLLNGNLDEANGERLVLNVLQTLTCLLACNDNSKASFRALVGKGYQTLQSLLLEFCQWRPSEALLNALLDMLVDGKFDSNASHLIQNEDVIILYLSVLQKSSESLRHYGLNMFQKLLRDNISNRSSCVRSGMLSFLLDWFSIEDNDTVILKIAQLIQVIGGHSVSGKDIRKFFALLRSEKVGTRQQYCSLLLTTMLSMLNEKGPTAFFDLNGNDSVSCLWC